MAYNKEVERKFLVEKEFLPDLNGIYNKHLVTFYLSIDSPEFMVRVEDKKRASLTIKGSNSNPLIRDEFSYDIPIEDAVLLDRYKRSNVIEKTRYLLPITAEECPELVGRSWEIDIFHGILDGLCLAEIELPQDFYKDVNINYPRWIGADVTTVGLYSNRLLSVLDTLPEQMLDTKVWKI